MYFIQVEKVVVLGTVYGIRQDKPWFYIGCLECYSKGQESWVTKDLPDSSTQTVRIFACVKSTCPKIKKFFGPW